MCRVAESIIQLLQNFTVIIIMISIKSDNNIKRGIQISS